MTFTLFPTYVHVQATEAERSQLGLFLRKEITGIKHSQQFQVLKKMKGEDAWDGTQCFFNYKANAFPIGLLQQVVDQFKVPKTNIVDKRKTLGIPYRHPKLNGIELYDYQREAVMRAFDARSCIVRVATNGGKSSIASGLVQILRAEKILIIVQSEDIFWQLRAEIMQRVGIFIGIVTADEAILDPYVNIAMIKTLMNRLDIDKTITAMFNATNMLICDEAHHSLAATYEALFSRSQATYRVGLSGTIPAPASYEGWKVRQYLGEIVIDVTNKELIAKGISAKPTIWFVPYGHKIPFQQLEAECERESGKDMSRWSIHFKKQYLARAVYRKVVDIYVRQNAERTRMVANIVARVFADKQTLVIVDNIDQGESITREIEAICGKDSVRFLSGEGGGAKMKKHRKESIAAFKENKFRVIVATAIFDEGISIPTIQLLVMASSKKSSRMILQRCGRSLRRKDGDNTVVIVDIFDMDEKYLENQANARYDLYKEEEFDITFHRFVDVDGSPKLDQIKEYASYVKRVKRRNH